LVDDNGAALVLTRQQWMDLCAHIHGKYAPTPHTANFIFDLAINGDPREEPTNFEREILPSRRFLHSVDLFLFSRCCALLAARIVVQVESTVEGIEQSATTDRSSQLELVQRLSSAYGGVEQGRRGSLRAVGPELLTVYSPAATDPPASGSREGHRDPDSNATAEDRQFDVTMVTLDAKVGATEEQRFSFHVLRLSERTPGGRISIAPKSEQPSFFRPSKQRANVSYLERKFNNLVDWTYFYLHPVREVCIHITGANVTVNILWTRYTVNLFYACNIALILLLVRKWYLLVLTLIELR
jgi:hypothetical protein